MEHKIKLNVHSIIHVGKRLVSYSIFKGNMNSDKYIEILGFKFVEIYDQNNHFTYQKDNSQVILLKNQKNISKKIILLQ